MGQVNSKSSTSSSDTILPLLPQDIKFRILIIGRANAGKTTILKRISSDSTVTKSPEVFRLDPGDRKIREPVELHPTIERGLHTIEDELVFTNHDAYIFHDSRGFEAGSEDELKIVREFVLRKSREKRLKDRLHAIWYCIPMTNSDRSELDLKHFKNICPDENVPVIAVFTKYDQFRYDIEMRPENQDRDAKAQLHDEIDRIFNKGYLANLKEAPPYIRLEKLHKDGAHCKPLIELTSNALSESAISLMLLAVQKCNLELSISQAVRKSRSTLERRPGSIEEIIKLCILAFPSLWYYVSLSLIALFPMF